MRSPVFDAMFTVKMSESLDGNVEIDDVPLTVLREVLK